MEFYNQHIGEFWNDNFLTGNFCRVKNRFGELSPANIVEIKLDRGRTIYKVEYLNSIGKLQIGEFSAGDLHK